MSLFDELMGRSAELQDIKSDFSNRLLEKAGALKQRHAEVSQEIAQNKDSLVSRAGLDPEGVAAGVLNAGASFASGASRVTGQLASMPAYIASSWDSSQLTDKQNQAYTRYVNGQATPEDMLRLSSKTYEDDRKENPTVLESIQSSQNKAQLGRDIASGFEISNIIHQKDRNQLNRDLSSGFGSDWDKTKAGWESLKSGSDGEGWSQLASGVGGLLANAGGASASNKQATLEYIVENIPQLALGGAGKLGTTALTASNIGYAIDEYQKGMEKFRNLSGGAMPDEAQRTDMATHAMSLALAEQAGDMVGLGSISKLIGQAEKAAVKAGFKASLKALGAETAKNTVTESATEGWQTYAEGMANLDPKSAEEIYTGAAIGGAAGGGMVAVSPVLSLPGAFSTARKEGNERAAQAEAKANVFKAAIESGSPDAYLDPKSENYSVPAALGVLHTLANKEGVTPEQRTQYAEKADSIITALDKQVSQLEGSLVPNSELTEMLSMAEQMLASTDKADTDGIAYLEENIAALKEQAAAEALPETEIESRTAQLTQLKTQLEQAKTGYNAIVSGQPEEDFKDVDVDALVSKVTAPTANQTPEAATETAQEIKKLRIMSMATPNVSVAQANAIANSAAASEGDKLFFKAYAEAATSIEQLKTMEQVGKEILHGDTALNQKGLVQYRSAFNSFMAQGNKYLARKEIDGLNRFIANQEGKVTAMNEAMSKAEETGLNYHVKKNENGMWLVTPLPVNTVIKKEDRVKGEYWINASDSRSYKLIENSASGLDAMNKTMAFMQQATKEETSNASTQTAPVQTNSTAGDTSTAPVAQGTADTPGGLAATGTTATGTQSQSQETLTTPAATPTGEGTIESKKPIKKAKPKLTEVEKGIRSLERALKRTVRNNGYSLWSSIKNRLNEADLNDIYGYEWKKRYTLLRSKPGTDLSTLVADGSLNEFLPHSLRFSDGYTTDPSLESDAVEFIKESLRNKDYLTEETKLELAQIGLTLAQLEDTLSLEDIQNEINEIESEQDSSSTGQQANEQGTSSEEAQATVSQEQEGSAVTTTSTEAAGDVTTEQEVETTDGKLSVFSAETAGTEEVRTHLKQSAGSDKGTKRPLVVVKDFINQILDTGVLAKFLKKTPSPKQMETLEKLKAVSEQWSKTISRLVKPANPGYEYASPASYFMTEVDGKMDFDQNMKTAMIVSALTWISDLKDQGMGMDKKSIKSVLGVSDDAYLSPETVDALWGVGVRRAIAANAIGSRIVQTLGLKATNTASKDTLPKIEASLGMYALEMLASQGVVQFNKISVDTWNGIATTEGIAKASADQIFVNLSLESSQNGNVVSVTDKAQNALEITAGSQNVLQSLFGVESGSKLPSFEPQESKQVRVQKGKTFIPKILKNILQKKDKEKTFLKQQIWNVLSGLSDDIIYEMAGAEEIDEHTQATEVRSKVSANEGIIREFENIRQFVEGSWAGIGNETPIYFTNVVWKNQRVGLVETVMNPQTSKLARHLLYRESWKTEIDVNDPKSFGDFKLRVLESFGVKTDRQTNEKSLDSALWKDKIENPVVQAAVDAMLARRENNELSAAQQQAILAAVKAGKKKFHTLDALNALVDMRLATEGKFTTDLIGEVDGVTNGPMLSHLLLGAGSKTINLASRLVKGGFFTQESEQENYNVWRSQAGSMDLYESTMAAVLSHANAYAGEPLYAAIQAITGNLYVEGKVTGEGRDLIKPAINALNFGSAVDKAVVSMAGSFVSQVFARISEYSKEGKDTAALIASINTLIGNPRLQLNPKMSIEALVAKKFSTAQIKAINSSFINSFGENVKETLKTEFEGVIKRRNSLNGSANLAHTMYQSVYNAYRKLYVEELASKGELRTYTNKKGVTTITQDLSAKQEAEFVKKYGLNNLIPIYNTSLSKDSGSLSSGLLISGEESALSSNSSYQTKIEFKSSSTGVNRIDLSTMQSQLTGPGVSTVPFLIHSFDSAISHKAAYESEALNIHDAHVIGIGGFTEVAQRLNKATWDQALSFSPAAEVYAAMTGTLNAVFDILNNKDTPVEVRQELHRSLNALLKERNDRVLKAGGKFIALKPYLIQLISSAKRNQVEADTSKLSLMAEMVAVDQYALEGGQYTVTPKDRQDASDMLADVEKDTQVSSALMANIERLDALLDENYVATETTLPADRDVSFDELPVVNPVTQTAVLKAVVGNKDTSEEMKALAQARLDEANLQLSEAAEDSFWEDDYSLNSYVNAVAQEANMTPFAALGTPAVAPEKDIEGIFDGKSTMSGKELAQALNAVLKSREGHSVSAFYRKLVAMAYTALGNDTKVQYITKDTKAVDVDSKPNMDSRGWFDPDTRTIYVLSSDFTASGLTAEMLVHELVHASVSMVLHDPKTKAEKQAVAELTALFNNAKKFVEESGIKGFDQQLSDIQEFVAYGMSDTAFQTEVLAKMPVSVGYKIKSGFKAFVDTLINLLNPNADSKTRTGLTEMLASTSVLFFSAAARAQETQISNAAKKVGLKSMSMASNPNSTIENFTTQQVFSSLSGSVGFSEKLNSILNDVVNTSHGVFGAIKSQVEKTAGKTAVDAWANAAARGERPFLAKILNANVKFTEQESFVAEQVEAVMGDVLKDKAAPNSVLYKEASKLYDQAKEALRGKIDADLYKFLFVAQRGMGGRSDYMQRFFALSLAHEGFNKSLQFETRKANLVFKGKTFLERVEVVWRAVVDTISARIAGTYTGQRADQRIEALARKLVQVEARHKDVIKAKKSFFDFMEPLETKGKELMDSGKKGVVKVANSRFVRGNSIGFIKLAGSVVDKVAGNRIEKVIDGMNAFSNTTREGRPNEAVQLINLIKGPTQWMNHMMNLAKRVESERKHVMHDVAKKVLSDFKDGGSYLKDEHKKAISVGLLRTGSHVLLDKHGIAGLQNMLENKTELDKAITDEIAALNAHPEVHYWIAQAKGLAFMRVTGWAGVKRQNLNAHNIANLYNTGRPSPASAKEVTPSIERLIALYGLKYSDKTVTNPLLEVMRIESERPDTNGVEATLLLYKHFEQDSKDKLFKGSDALHMHGYLPEVHNPRIELAIARSQEEAEALENQGFTLKTQVPTDKHDPDTRPVYLYSLKGAGLARWQSGAMSNTGTGTRGKQKHNQFFNQASPLGIANMQSMTQIFNSEQAEVAAQFNPNPGFVPNKDENRMVPVLNASGNMVDYRYTMKEYLRDELLERDNRFEHLMGVMAATTYDKVESREQNKELIKGLHELYKNQFGEKGEKGFVYVGATSEDPAMKEAWDMLPSNTQRDIKAMWNQDGIWVPKELVLPIFGYRKATLSSLFDQETKNFMEQLFVDFSTMMVRNYASRILKLNTDDAEKYTKRTATLVRQTEDVTADIVHEMKDTIVIKTISTLWGNMTSNTSVLFMNGMNPKDAMLYQLEGLRAVMDYTRDRSELSQINLELAKGNATNVDELMGRGAELENSIAANPAKKLIDAGLLPTIVDDVEMEDNPYSYKSSFVEWAEGKTSKLNRHVVGAGKQLYMAHDTMIYKFLNKSTQYSDFVSRYALYKHETTKRNPLSEETALFNASEAFINYSFHMPRTLQYLDDHGFMMFFKYFFNIQRVIARLVRDKPLSVLNTIALNNMLGNFSIVTESSFIHKIGNNPASMSALGFPFLADDLATTKAIGGMFN